MSVQNLYNVTIITVNEMFCAILKILHIYCSINIKNTLRIECIICALLFTYIIPTLHSKTE